MATAALSPSPSTVTTTGQAVANAPAEPLQSSQAAVVRAPQASANSATERPRPASSAPAAAPPQPRVAPPATAQPAAFVPQRVHKNESADDWDSGDEYDAFHGEAKPDAAAVLTSAVSRLVTGTAPGAASDDFKAQSSARRAEYGPRGHDYTQVQRSNR